jgi:beta-hydroxylase
LTPRQRRRKRVKKAGKRLIRAVSDFISSQSRIGVGPVFPPTVFPWLAPFEANWLRIREELEQVLANRDALPSFHELSPDQKRISRGDNWKIFPFYAFGESFEPNLARCPETARLLKQAPNLRNAMFSILSPHYHIPPHCGPTNGIIRIHLGLIVPGGQDVCRIRVGDRIFGWQEGKCVVFDDYFEHEVWNDTDRARVVLFFDVDRPLKPLGWLVNRFVIAAIKRSAYVKDARENARQWNTHYTDFESKRSAENGVAEE